MQSLCRSLPAQFHADLAVPRSTMHHCQTGYVNISQIRLHEEAALSEVVARGVTGPDYRARPVCTEASAEFSVDQSPLRSVFRISGFRSALPHGVGFAGLRCCGLDRSAELRWFEARILCTDTSRIPRSRLVDRSCHHASRQ